MDLVWESGLWRHLAKSKTIDMLMRNFPTAARIRVVSIRSWSMLEPGADEIVVRVTREGALDVPIGTCALAGGPNPHCNICIGIDIVKAEQGRLAMLRSTNNAEGETAEIASILALTEMGIILSSEQVLR